MKTKFLILVLVFGILNSAHSFCGFYVAGADAKLFNEASQVILTRHDNISTITMSSDFEGNVEDFATVIPVPSVLEENQIKVVPQEIMDNIDKYSAPRLVEYHDYNPCNPYRYLESVMFDAMVPLAGNMDSVTIEAEYTVGEYDILILSATESNALEIWLHQNGYKIPEGASEVLRSYIKQDMKFFVAKVNTSELKKLGVKYLRPLQVQFDSPKFMLPLRLGTVNARGLQELLIYAISSKGRIEAVNYKNVELPTGLDLPSFVKEDFGPFYKAMFYKLAKEYKHSAVFTEYFWNMRTCDPCATNPLPDKDLEKLGVTWINNATIKQNNFKPAYITRMHVRYSAKSFPEDIVFQETGNTTHYQARYILRHPWKGDEQCEEADTYRSKRAVQETVEMQNLSYITGWDVESQIKPRINDGTPIIIEKPEAEPIHVIVPQISADAVIFRLDGTKVYVPQDEVQEWILTNQLKPGLYIAKYPDGRVQRFMRTSY